MEVVKTNGSTMVAFDPKRAESFVERLNDKPVEGDVLVNTQAGGALYVPISVIENKLDELFFGLWQTKGYNWQVIANEVVGSIDLGVYHPILREWIWRTGAGSVMIQQVSPKRGGTGDITDIGQKIRNTLVKDFPHLKAECLKNAAKSLGKIFGRDLNRKLEDDYIPMTEQMEAHGEALKLISECDTPQSLVNLWRDNPQWQSMAPVIDAFTNKKAELHPRNPKNAKK